MTDGTGLHVGVGEMDITPPLGTQLAGDIGRVRPAEEIRGRLFVRALTVDDGKTAICLVAMETLGITKEYADQLRCEAAELLGTVPEAVMIHAHQSHSAPMVGNHGLRNECTFVPEDSFVRAGAGKAYVQQFLDAARDAIRQAKASMRPARLSAARGSDGRVAHNRRFIMRNGKAKTHPPVCSPDILHVEGPTDPEVGVAVFSDEHATPFAVLLHHTCHPVHGYPKRWISPDWPGAWSDAVRSMLGGAVPLVVNGCCGNIHHCNHLDPDTEKTDTIEIMAERLAETTRSILPRLQPITTPDVAFRSSRLDLPWRPHSQEDIERAKSLLAAHPTPPWRDEARTSVPWDWVFAVALLDELDYRKRQPRCDLELQAFRIGDFVLVGWPGEPFVEGQLQVKKASPFTMTFMAHWCNDAICYIGTDRAYEGGGYEVELPWCRLGPGALEAMSSRTIAILEELKST